MIYPCRLPSAGEKKVSYHDGCRTTGCVGQMQRLKENKDESTSTWEARYRVYKSNKQLRQGTEEPCTITPDEEVRCRGGGGWLWCHQSHC